MNSIITIDQMSVKGEMSIQILKAFWTTARIAEGLKNGDVKMDSLGDNSLIRDCEGRAVARVIRSNMCSSGIRNVTFSKNTKLPYFFMIDEEELRSMYPPARWGNSEILLGAKHPEGSRYGYVFGIVKKDNGIYFINEHIEFEVGLASGSLRRLERETLEDWISYPADYMHEYIDLLKEEILPRL